MNLNHFSIVTNEMNQAITFFRDVMALPTTGDETYAEVNAGKFVFNVVPSALVPLGRPQGIILQFEVEDVYSTTQRLQENGARLLREPQKTDWGTESAFIAGPDGLVVEIYRWIQSGHNDIK